MLETNVQKSTTPSRLKYEIQGDGTVTITGCDKTVTSVEIPSQLEGKLVTTIGEYVFYDCSDNLTIICGQNSAAHEYAQANGHEVSLIKK